MAEKPIIFSGPMVRAILEGKKTQTRRVMKVQPVLDGRFWRLDGAAWSDRVKNVTVAPGHSLAAKCPFGVVGEFLWVRETFNVTYGPYQGDQRYGLHYAADGAAAYYWPNYDKSSVTAIDAFAVKHANGRTLSSIHMPRWVSRITLKITGVHVERLQDISGRDCLAEGIYPKWLQKRDNGIYPDVDPGIEAETSWLRRDYKDLWDSINGKTPGHTWGDNPWVWVVEFQRVEQEVSNA